LIRKIKRGVVTMEKLFRCKDIGNRCGFEARGGSEEEVLEKAAEHAKTAHSMNDKTKRLFERLRIAIRTR
jgi:predicted small metal-binding protein